jgi:hypothetical protein
VLHVLELEELVNKGCEFVMHSKCLMICFNEYACAEIFGVI